MLCLNKAVASCKTFHCRGCKLMLLFFDSRWNCCLHRPGSSTGCCWPGTGRAHWFGGSRRRWCQTPPNASAPAAAPPPERSPRGEGWSGVRGDRRTRSVRTLANQKRPKSLLRRMRMQERVVMWAFFLHACIKTLAIINKTFWLSDKILNDRKQENVL